MQMQFTARHFEAPPSLRAYVDKRIAKLERYYDGITDVHIVLEKEPTSDGTKSAEVTLGVYRQRLTARNMASTHEQAIDQCVARLRRQIMRYKAKLRSTNRHYQR